MKKIITIVGLLILLCIVYNTCYFRTSHFAGQGKYFGAGVNIVNGKSNDLIIRNISNEKIENIEFVVYSRLGFNAKGSMSLDINSYYRGDISVPIIVNKFDVITIKLNWDKREEVIKLKNID